MTGATCRQTRVTYVEIRPCPELAPYVHRFWRLSGPCTHEHPVLNRVLPDGCVDIVVDLGNCVVQGADKVAPVRPQINIVGAMTRPKVFWHLGNVDLLGIRFRPGQARRVIGIPLQETTDRSVPVNDLDSRLKREMDWATEATTTKDRCSRLETLLIKRFQEADISKDLVQGAVNAICRTRGQIKIARLESALGTSARSLERRFLESVGLTPKILCRIARFQHTVSVLSRRRTVARIDLVGVGGFFDQSHLLREFKALAGLLPRAWVDERRGVGFIQYMEPLLEYTRIPGTGSQKEFSECQESESFPGR